LEDKDEVVSSFKHEDDAVVNQLISELEEIQTDIETIKSSKRMKM
jgi:hypothetical protein